MTKKLTSIFNPFGLPGLDGIPNVAPLTGQLADSADFLKNLWGGGGSSSIPGFLAPTLSVEELDKKITDLRAVESWLETNAALLRATVQSLEVQRNTLLLLQSMGQMNSASAATAVAPAQSDSTDSGASASSSATTKPAPAMVNAAAWWNLLQDQFGKVAGAALAQAVPGHGLGAAAPKKKTASVKTTKKASPRKRTIKQQNSAKKASAQ